jgi:hypothetical protein
MKKVIISVSSACILSLVGCAGLSGGSGVTNLITPATLQLAAENGTYLALEKQPQLLQPFEAVVTGITNSTAGGTFTLSTTTLTSTLAQLGFSGLANQPGAALLIDDLSGLTTQLDEQLGTNSITSNTNFVPDLNAIASGMERGIQIYKQ